MMATLGTLVTRAAVVGLLMLLGGFLVLGLGSVIHLITLPMELDASFGRALPMLREGGYLKSGDEPHAKRLLRAAALTYVSVSLMSLLNVALSQVSTGVRACIDVFFSFLFFLFLCLFINS